MRRSYRIPPGGALDGFPPSRTPVHVHMRGNCDVRGLYLAPGSFLHGGGFSATRQSSSNPASIEIRDDPRRGPSAVTRIRDVEILGNKDNITPLFRQYGILLGGKGYVERSVLRGIRGYDVQNGVVEIYKNAHVRIYDHVTTNGGWGGLAVVAGGIDLVVDGFDMITINDEIDIQLDAGPSFRTYKNGTVANFSAVYGPDGSNVRVEDVTITNAIQCGSEPVYDFERVDMRPVTKTHLQYFVDAEFCNFVDCQFPNSMYFRAQSSELSTPVKRVDMRGCTFEGPLHFRGDTVLRLDMSAPPPAIIGEHPHAGSPPTRVEIRDMATGDLVAVVGYLETWTPSTP